jgi:hypothetical protein
MSAMLPHRGGQWRVLLLYKHYVPETLRACGADIFVQGRIAALPE